MKYVPYAPIAGESMNCEPPTAVNASSEHDDRLDAGLLDVAPGSSCANGETLNHARAWPGQPLQDVDRRDTAATAPRRTTGGVQTKSGRVARVAERVPAQRRRSRSRARARPSRTRGCPRARGSRSGAAAARPPIGIRSCCERVAVADRDRVVLERLLVDRERPRRADLVLAAVALADRGRVVVLGRHHAPQLLVQRPRLARPCPRPCRSAAARRPSPAPCADGSRSTVRMLARDLLLVVGVDQERERGAVGARGRLDHVRDVALLVADPLELRARVLGVRGRGRSRRGSRCPRAPTSRSGRGTRGRSCRSSSARARRRRARARAGGSRAGRGRGTSGAARRSSTRTTAARRPAARRTPSPSARTRACGRGSSRA